MPFLVIDEVAICCRSAFPGQQIYLRTEHGTRDRTEIPPGGLGSRRCVVGNSPAASAGSLGLSAGPSVDYWPC